MRPLLFTSRDLLVPLYSPPSMRRKWNPREHPSPTVQYVGQLKLWCSEVAAFEFAMSRPVEECHLVYAGAASGQHIPALLDLLYPEVTADLYDPREFAFVPSSQIRQHRSLFLADTADKWRDFEKPVVFISDIRTSGDTEEEHETEINQNMEMQADWVERMRPEMSLLKFRIPFPDVEARKMYPYFEGLLGWQVFAKPFSMELRLAVNRTQAELGPEEFEYDSWALEEEVFYHNTVERPSPSRFMNVVTGESNEYGDPQFNRGFDCTYLLFVLSQYLKRREGRLDEDRLMELAERVVHITSQGRWNLANRAQPRVTTRWRKAEQEDTRKPWGEKGGSR